MNKKYKVINLNIIESDYTGMETLLAELSEIEYIKMPHLNNSSGLFSTRGEMFVLNPDNIVSRYLMSNPESLKTLNLEEFTEGTINLKEGKRKAYYHKDYLKRKADLLGK